MKLKSDQLDWKEIENSLFEFGYAKTPPLFSSTDCEKLIGLYTDNRSGRARSRKEK